MKGETLPQDSAWTGIPTKRASASRIRLGPPKAVTAVPEVVPAAPSAEEMLRARIDLVAAGRGEDAADAPKTLVT
jgi:hypothetical protein